MRRFVLATFASTLLFASSAHAQAWPTPSDLANGLQQLQQLAPVPPPPGGCPTVEVGPNVHVAICPNALPKPPPGLVLPEAVFPAVTPAPFVDLRARNLDGPVMHQQQTGVCYAFAITDVLDNSLRRQGRGDVLSPLHFVSMGGYSTIFTPTSEALDLEASWPYDPRKACRFEQGRDECEHAYGIPTGSWRSDPQLVAERERARGLGVATLRPATTLTRDPVGGMVNALSMGRSIYLVLGIDSAAWSYSSVRTGLLREYTVADRGDHAVAVVGYRFGGNERQFLLHNSWGTDWGEKGYVWIGEANLRRHFTSAYLLDAVPVRGAPVLPPLPTAPSLPALPAFPAWPALPAWPVPRLPIAPA